MLVANRGEIACRIIRSAQARGLRTVAVFSDPDRGAPHVALADAAVHVGAAPARESYLRADRILAAAQASGAGAIHPGYGLLSEDAAFARAVEAAGIAFVGPTPEQLEQFGDKHRARELARAAGVPMVEGSTPLPGVAAALAAAAEIGYPVMLKATAGGGGIGMAPCHDAAELADAFARVERVAAASFGGGGIFLERWVARARHVEVQVFGDGAGRVLALGDRDCSLQRRNQKVIEEAPAPALPDALRERLHAAAVALTASVAYRSAGTVEFLYDAEREQLSFLEVNPRLQVEHPVTEEVRGIDLVDWMLRLAQGDAGMFDATEAPARALAAHAVEARVYAEDPAHDHRPSAGLLTNVELPADLRVDGWVTTGTEVSTAYDPLLAKLVATGATRAEAIARLADGLARTRIDGVRTNLGLLRAALAAPDFAAARHSTATLATVHDDEPRIEVERAGTLTTVQDWPGRIGYWMVGVPPSGPMDDRSFRLGNRALGNPEGAPGLECTLDGPALRFTAATTVCVTGAEAQPLLDGQPVPCWEPVDVPAGGLLEVGALRGRGLRAYVLVAGGLDLPRHLGSAATFTLGGMGGHGGRALRVGDVLTPGGAPSGTREQAEAIALPSDGAWEIAVTEGPHAAPEFFTRADVEQFYATAWEVHFNSARTGVRLIGPRPRWARPDGGEAGLHPSNIHDTPYAIGAVDFTGDLPILLGPDGPSLGGFVCPATVVTAERWKLGQLRPGDTVRFVSVAEEAAAELRAALPAPASAARPAAPPRRPLRALAPAPRDDGILARRDATPDTPAVTYRRAGDDNLLVEYGPMVLDLGLRMRVHALAERIAAEAPRGLLDVTPGIRSLQLHADPDLLPPRRLLALAQSLELELPATRELQVPSRTVHLPLSWDDPATREATARYMAGVRADAPWCPWNIEFIRRVNGLDSVEDVHRTVFGADYLVLGLGDVYLGAPVATPLDPRHRLVTTKYNPARTWTPQNAVGIGGAYLCIYGMEGPGGYQFVGRTVQIWSGYRAAAASFEADTPWLLRFFDRIRWHPVAADELLELRAEMDAGRLELEIEQGSFTLADHLDFLERERDDIDAFRARQTEAFAAERAAWQAAGEFDPRPEPVAAVPGNGAGAGALVLPPGAVAIEAPLSASVWLVEVRPGDRVDAGQRLLTLEAMKMETALESPVAGEVVDVLVGVGDQVSPGTSLVVVRAS
ncbi:urea carboxylase [Conexibacter stalactiti]|uniref:Urea carboxylase n=1 Tax=Conexibacter stalactiti TaxID=1940611 RepID=A0ABU4HSX4_9ACTN|nr:urea carboxylase [Conexibacter stalactiti]MDW5596340.1 urea carboxylase [Conexibacter stalactiti]MEC5036982.1 urea carboxylase [Conexibacter stalactiti]